MLLGFKLAWHVIVQYFIYAGQLIIDLEHSLSVYTLFISLKTGYRPVQVAFNKLNAPMEASVAQRWKLVI